MVVDHLWALLRRVHTVSVSLVSDEYMGKACCADYRQLSSFSTICPRCGELRAYAI